MISIVSEINFLYVVCDTVQLFYDISERRFYLQDNTFTFHMTYKNVL